MKNKLIINVGCVLLVLILVSIRLISHWEMKQLAHYEQEQDFTFTVIQNLDHLLKLTSDVRRERRDFVRSGDEKYLELYNKSLEEAGQELKHLENIAIGHPWLQERVTMIDLHVKEKLAEYREQVNLRKTSDQHAVANGKNDRAKMSEIRVQVAATKDEAVMHMRRLTANQKADFKKMENLLAANSVIIFILVTTVFLILRRDIASRVKMNEHVAVVQEQERLSLAREVHDDIGQSLTALKLDVTWIERRLLPDGNEMAERLAEMCANLDQLLAKTHDITAKLRPPLLDNLGLAAAIEWQVSGFRRRSGIECHLLLNEDISVYDQHVALAIIRILQEALTNITRHARATEVSISMCERGDEFVLEISDNGCGMTTKESDSLKAYGIMGMRERASLCNGKLIINGNKGKGTTVSLTIPRYALKEKK